MAATPDIDAIEAAVAQGALLPAYDATTALIATGTVHPRVRYLRILALARMGETAEALREMEAAPMPEELADEDSLALRGRLLKDLALRSGSSRTTLFHQASDAYLAAHRSAGGYFSLINAATLAKLAGDDEAAKELARKVLAFPEVAAARSFYSAATAAEAAVLLGDQGSAERALAAALACNDATLGSRAATAKQLRTLAEHTASPATAALAELAMPPPVLVYSGPMFRPDATAERIMAGRIDAILADRDIRIGFGSAAAGADLLVAEALLRRGAELNLVLPFAEADFVEESVLPFGDGWQARFKAIMANAHSITYATATSYVGDPGQFDYGNEVAMGHACLRAEHLQTSALLLVFPDKEPDDTRDVSSSVVERWRDTGRPMVAAPSGPINRSPFYSSGTIAVAHGRESRSMIFTDFSGYSRLDEQRLPHFLKEVMGRMAAILETCSDDVLFRNTWGDALFAVITDPVAAADVALKLTETLRDVDPVALGLEAGAGMRIGLHHGPIYQALDPITAQRSYFGSEVTYTARLEPVTPVGKVYATQPFAALLALSGDPRFRCQYVGPVSLAKAFATLPMYRLSRGQAS